MVGGGLSQKTPLRQDETNASYYPLQLHTAILSTVEKSWHHDWPQARLAQLDPGIHVEPRRHILK